MHAGKAMHAKPRGAIKVQARARLEESAYVCGPTFTTTRSSTKASLTKQPHSSSYAVAVATATAAVAAATVLLLTRFPWFHFFPHPLAGDEVKEARRSICLCVFADYNDYYVFFFLVEQKLQYF